MMPSFLRNKLHNACHSKKGTGCQTVETSHTGRYRSQELSINILFSCSAVGAHEKVILSPRVTFHFSSVPGVTTAIMPTSEKVSTPSTTCVLDKLVMKSRYKSSLPMSRILFVHCTSWWTKSVKWCKVPMPEKGREEIVVQLNHKSDL